MHPFRYERAADVPAAVTLLAESPHGAFLGGGTNLIDLMKYGVEQPTTLIDVTHLDLIKIEPTPSGTIMVGAMVRNSDLAHDPRDPSAGEAQGARRIHVRAFGECLAAGARAGAIVRHPGPDAPCLRHGRAAS